MPVSFSKSGMILFLNGTRPPSTNAPITTLPLALRTRPAFAVDTTGDAPTAAPTVAALVTNARRVSTSICCSFRFLRCPQQLGAIRASRVWTIDSVHRRGSPCVEEARRVGIHEQPDGRADRRVPPALGAD